ncbi:MAG: spore cortex biosynthesis protein YabQ [Acutalibacter sp.]|jgi:hypothetical protein
MSTQALSVVSFCLSTGAALGCLFLLFRMAAWLLGMGKLGTAVLDVLFCCLCGAAVFLCALAVDSGSLRLYQAVLQGAGGWAVVVSLGPWVQRLTLWIRRRFCKVWEVLGKGGKFVAGHFPAKKGPKGHPQKKRGKNKKNQRKKT